jgi:hypothetical protein
VKDIIARQTHPGSGSWVFDVHTNRYEFVMAGLDPAIHAVKRPPAATLEKQCLDGMAGGTVPRGWPEQVRP